MSTDIKLSKAQMSKVIQSGESFGTWLANLGKKALTNIVIPLARDNLSRLVSNLTSSAINKFDRKKSGKGAVRSKRIYFIYFKWRYELYHKDYKIIRRFGCINWWRYWNSKDEIKKQEAGFHGTLLAPLAALLVQPVISSVVKVIGGRGIRRAGRGCMVKIFLFRSIL